MSEGEVRAVKIVVAGEGAGAERWTRALRGVAGAETVCADGGSQEDVLALLGEHSGAALAIVMPYGDPGALVRRALLGRRHVLIAGETSLPAHELTALEAIARRRGRTVMLDAGFAHDERVAFVRKMCAGAQALWKPRYLRSLRTGVRAGGIDEALTADIELLSMFAHGQPERVSAIAPAGGGEAAFVTATLAYESGLIARIDVAAAETEGRHEAIVACEGRAVKLVTQGRAGWMQIMAPGAQRGPGGGTPWDETISAQAPCDGLDSEARTAEAFVAAVRADDADGTNVASYAAAAAVREACRRSMRAGGEWTELGAAAAQAARRPALQVIEGGGKSAPGGKTPRLRIVASGGGAPAEIEPQPA